MNRNKILNVYKILIIFFIFFGFINTEAATLSVSPGSHTVSVGNIFTLKVKVDTQGKYINNTEAIIQFPTDLLEVVSVSKSSSIFSLWVEEPSFSNYTGKVNFNGGISTPGFIGSDGLISSITFKAKKQGNASVILSEGAVRANDGFGTDVLSAKNSSYIQIGTPKQIEIPNTPIITSSSPSRPVILSETHPDQNKWYQDNNISFKWKIPSDVNSLKTLFNKSANSEPSVLYDNSVTGKTLNDVGEGTYYFHLKFFNQQGGSQISHYRVNVDYSNPILTKIESKNEDGHSLLKINATDSISGINHYTIMVDGSDEIRVVPSDIISGWYKLPVLEEGYHDILVSAFDKANNRADFNLSINSPLITPPIISINQTEINNGDFIVVNGSSNYPSNQVEVHLEADNKEIGLYTQEISKDGTFSITTDKIRNSGVVTVWARNVLSENIKSGSSEKYFVKVNENKAVRITLSILYPLMSIVFIIIILIIIIIMMYIGWHKYFGLKNRVEKQSKQITSEVHKAMLLLKEELDDQLDILEKTKQDRVLNSKEEKIFNEIKYNISKVDDFIENKIKNIK